MDMGAKCYCSSFTDDSGCFRVLQEYCQDKSQSLGVSLSCSSSKMLNSSKALLQRKSAGFDHDNKLIFGNKAVMV